MSKIKVTQVRSIIGRNETQKRTIQALGLGKINRSRIHNDSSALRGMINRVKHLVTVEEAVDNKTEEVVDKQEQETKSEES
jgi:large subunit ribosomal protein L30